MKHSMHNWMRPEPIETTLERLHRFGYDGIEISGDPERYNTDEVRALMDKYEIECWGGVTMMFEGRDLIHPDRGVRAATIAYMKDCLRMTKALGGVMFCIVPSTVGKVKPLASSAEEWRWAVEGLKEVAAFAADQGAEDSDHHVADEPEAAALHDHAREPASDDADDDEPEELHGLLPNEPDGGPTIGSSPPRG